MSRTALAAALGLCLPASGLAQTASELVARNVAARGGAAAWQAVSSLRLTGRMDVGRGMLVTYVLEQKRPRKMRLEFVFDGETPFSAPTARRGWKVTPFRGRTAPEPMTDEEMRETVSSADLYGLLFDYAARGLVVELLGREPVEGQHFFHPLHLWCLCGGHGIRYFRLYETWIWQPLVRRLLTEKSGGPRSGMSTISQVSTLLKSSIAHPSVKTLR